MGFSKARRLISAIFVLTTAATSAQQESVDDKKADSPDTRHDPSPDQQLAAYGDLSHEGGLDEAENVAKRNVEVTIALAGPRSMEMADALTDLGIAQLRRQQYDAAQQNFESAIEIIVETEDRMHALLIGPLEGLGNAQLGRGRPDLAAQTFKRAVHITHVNEGPHNIDQVETLESLAEAHLQMGNTDDANDTQETIYALNQRNHKEDPLALVEPLMRRAEWQHRSGHFQDERSTYRDVLRIITAERGKHHISLVKPLIKLGETYLYIDITGAQPLAGTKSGSGDVHYKRAIRIVESDPNASWEIVVDARIALGDFYSIQGDYNRATSNYMRAWQFMSEDESRHFLRDNMLGQVRSLTKRSIPLYSGNNRAPYGPDAEYGMLEGAITASYLITDRGRVHNLVIAEVQPPEFTEMARHVERELRRQLFQPRFDNTGPIETPHQVFTHKFFYLQAEQDALRIGGGDVDN